MLEIAEPGAAPLLLDRDAVHAELAELRPEVAREGVAAVDLVGARRDLVGGEAAHAVAQHVGGLAQAEIEAAKVVDAHGRWSSRDGASAPRLQSTIGRFMHVLDRARNMQWICDSAMHADEAVHRNGVNVPYHPQRRSGAGRGHHHHRRRHRRTDAGAGGPCRRGGASASACSRRRRRSGRSASASISVRMR